MSRFDETAQGGIKKKNEKKAKKAETQKLKDKKEKKRSVVKNDET